MYNTCTIWVCIDCVLHHANGECANCHTDEGHDREVWCWIGNANQKVTMGMLAEEHSCKSSDEIPHAWECGCETQSFSWSSCDGCGSTLSGERHAFTVWFD